MSEFLKSYELVISTLSPVHIGCGEDYLPTNYVMADECLYPFHDIAEDAFSSEQQRDTLLKQCNSIHGLWNIFHSETYLKTMKAIADRYVPMKAGVQTQQNQRIQNTQFPLVIERTAYDTYTGLPILPGSGIKGAIRTAVLEQLASQKVSFNTTATPDNSATQMRLMEGKFTSDPLRLFKISDAHLSSLHSQEPTHILTRHSRHRANNTTTSVHDRNQNFVESIMPFMENGFHSELVLNENNLEWQENRIATKVKNIPIGSIIKACNEYYLKRLEEQNAMLQMLQMGNWYSQIIPLVRQAIHEGRGFLLRIGKHAGADYLTIKQYRRIKTKHEKSPTAKTLPISTTLCSYEKTFLPFGWVFVEIREHGRATVANPLHLGLQTLRFETSVKEAEARHQNFIKQRTETQSKLVAKKIEFANKQAEQAATTAREAQEKTERTARLATLSPALLEVENFISAFRLRSEQLRGDKENLNADFHGRARKLAATALESIDWALDEKRAAADAIAEWLPIVVKGIDKDQLKKLKLSALRGLV